MPVTNATTGGSPAGVGSPGTVPAAAAAAAAPAALPHTLSSPAAAARSRPPAGPGASLHPCRPVRERMGQDMESPRIPGSPSLLPSGIPQPSVCHSQGVPACPIGNHSASRPQGAPTHRGALTSHRRVTAPGHQCDMALDRKSHAFAPQFGLHGPNCDPGEVQPISARPVSPLPPH